MQTILNSSRKHLFIKLLWQSCNRNKGHLFLTFFELYIKIIFRMNLKSFFWFINCVVIVGGIYIMDALFCVVLSGLDISTAKSFISSGRKKSLISFWIAFLSSLHVPNNKNLGSPIFLCLYVTLLDKNLFFDPSTQTSCEEILCSI